MAHEIQQIDQKAVLRAVGINAHDPKAQALLLVCERYGLDPLLKHVVLITGNIYVTRDGLLNVAHRSKQLDGIVVESQGETQTHYLATVSVYRKDMTHPFRYIGRYPKQGGNKQYAPEMAVKCAEVMALRRAFNVALCAREEIWEQAEDHHVSEPIQARAIEPPTRRPPPPAHQPTAIQYVDMMVKAWNEFDHDPDATVERNQRIVNHALTAALMAGHISTTEIEIDGKRDRKLSWSAFKSLVADHREWLDDVTAEYLREKQAEVLGITPPDDGSDQVLLPDELEETEAGVRG